MVGAEFVAMVSVWGGGLDNGDIDGTGLFFGDAVIKWMVGDPAECGDWPRLFVRGFFFFVFVFLTNWKKRRVFGKQLIFQIKVWAKCVKTKIK